jgi:hypothetical protein
LRQDQLARSKRRRLLLMSCGGHGCFGGFGLTRFLRACRRRNT